MKYSIKIGRPDKIKTPCIVIGLFEGGSLSTTATTLDKASNGYIRKLVKRGDIKGSKNELVLLRDIEGISATRLLIIGLGKKTQFKAPEFVSATKTVIQNLRSMDIKSALVCLLEPAKIKKDLAWKSQKLVETFEDGLYQFQNLKEKTKSKKPQLQAIDIFINDEKDLSVTSKGMQSGQALSLGIKKAKDLGNLPGNLCNPEYLADQAKELARKYRKVTTNVMDEKEIESRGMGAFMSVTKGSDAPGKLITISYKGSKPKEAPHVIIGKGITFDSGGISLKPGAGMHEMIWDMCGAAAAFGTILAAAEQKLSINLIVILAAAENMPSGSASRPGDIVKSMSGQTIEILNTDAEGRLVLCDSLTYAEEFEPETVIDVATLTGACIIALGSHATAMYSNDEGLARSITKAGEDCLDRVWQMPLWGEYQSQINSGFADVANVGGREAGSITAACFLSRFAEKYKWAHLDIAGTAFNGSGLKKGSTGRPVSLLFEYLSSLEK